MRISQDFYYLMRAFAIFSWENCKKFSNYMDNCARKFTRINLMSFCNFLMRKCAKSHVKIYEILMRTSCHRLHERAVGEEKSHEKLMKPPKSHEKTSKKSREKQNLMRFSWDLMESSWKSHENFCFFFFSHENLMRFSWEFAKPHENFCKGKERLSRHRPLRLF